MKTRGEGMVEDEDSMRPEYDFSQGIRGATAQRYAQGANVVVISPEVLDVFPTVRPSTRLFGRWPPS